MSGSETKLPLYRWWAAEPSALDEAVQQLNSADADYIRMRQQEATAGGGTRRASGGVARIDLVGIITKSASLLTLLTGGTPVNIFIREVEAAARDPRVTSIELRVDSPGGSSAGSGAAAEAVRQAARQKPVTAFIEDIGASAAYRIAAQAGRLFASPDAMVGSLGTYMVLEDSSEQARRMGLRVHVVRAGEFKGLGIPGQQVTDAQVEQVQRTVNQLNDRLIDDVARGRRISEQRVRELADGRIHIAAEAQRLGLIDGVRTSAPISGGAGGGSRSAAQPGPAGGHAQPAEQAEPAATIYALKAHFPWKTPADRLRCVEQGMTLDQAERFLRNRGDDSLQPWHAGMGIPNDEQQHIDTEPTMSNQKDEQTKLAEQAERFDDLVRQKVDEGHFRSDAVHIIARKYPNLHKAALQHHNPQSRIT